MARKECSEQRQMEQKLDTKFSDRLSTEITHELNILKLVMPHTAEIRARLKQLYQEYFPKKCGSCGNLYQTRQQYLTVTKQLDGDSTLLDYGDKVFEYRNCTCGSTLLVVMDDRRDETKWGDMRRDIFNDCLELISMETKLDHDAVIPTLREIFDSICNDIGVTTFQV